VTRVDFYVLESDSDDAWLRLACRIAEKAMLSDLNVFVHTNHSATAERLDAMLWTFAPGSFVPHRILGAGATIESAEPVLIGTGEEPTGDRWDLMVNLGDRVPEFFSRYDRVAEVIDGNRERRGKGRERYRYYRDRGYKVETHNID
jgi:DNA polymerase-3 subunit chi